MTEDPESRLRQLLGDLTGQADALHTRAVELSAKTGYIREATHAIASGYQAALGSGAAGDDHDSMVASGLTIAGTLAGQLSDLGDRLGQSAPLIDTTISVASAASATVTTICSSLNIPSGDLFKPCPFSSGSDEHYYAAKLEELDPDLASTYREAWRLLFTPVDDPKRPALWQMRQVYDHLFCLLAPDDEVRGSSFWIKKPPPREDRVDRDERIRFAASRWITDEDARQTLRESASETQRAYRRLNAAHKRGALSSELADQAFRGVDTIVRRWIDAVHPWPPGAA